MHCIVPYLRILLRASQCALSLVAITTISGAFRSVSYGSDVYSASLGSNISTFVTILTYSSLIYSLWYLIGVEIMARYVLSRLHSWIYDASFIILYLCASLILSTSSLTRKCESYNGLLRCGHIRAASLFLYLNLAAYITSMVMDYYASKTNGSIGCYAESVAERQEDDTISYVGNWTPKTSEQAL